MYCKPKKGFHNPSSSHSDQYFQLQRCELLYELKEGQSSINSNNFNIMVFKIVPH